MAEESDGKGRKLVGRDFTVLLRAVQASVRFWWVSDNGREGLVGGEG